VDVEVLVVKLVDVLVVVVPTTASEDAADAVESGLVNPKTNKVTIDNIMLLLAFIFTS